MALVAADAADRLVRLNREVEQLYVLGRRRDALDLALQARQAALDAVGRDHPLAASSLQNLATIYDALGDRRAAEACFHEAIDILRARRDADPLALAGSLASLGTLHESQGEFASAETVLVEALEIRRAVLPADDPALGRSVLNLAVLYEAMGAHDRADLTLTGWDHHEGIADEPWFLSVSLINLAEMFRSEGNYRAAEAFARQGIESARSRLQGHPHLQVGRALNDLGVTLEFRGDYAQAEAFYEEALAAIVATAQYAPAQVATIEHNIGRLRYHRGDYRGADLFLHRALERRVALFGPDNPSVANTRNTVALVQGAVGDFRGAERLLQEGLTVLRATLPAWHSDIADTLNNLGYIARALHDDERAARLYAEALELRQSALGDYHPAVAESLNNLGAVCFGLGDLNSAESLYTQALDIRRRALGGQHPFVAQSLNNLGALAGWAGRVDDAERRFREALGVYREAVGTEHPQVGVALWNLAEVLAATERTSEAMALMTQSVAIQDANIGTVFSIASESQRMAHLTAIRATFEAFLSFLLSDSPSSDTVQIAMDLVLRRKGLAAEAMSAQREAVLAGRYPELVEKLREVSVLKTQIGQRILAGPGPEGVPAHRQFLREWSEREERIEAELARQIPEIAETRTARPVDTGAIGRALAAKSALIEVVRFAMRDFATAIGPVETCWSGARYVAFVVRTGERAQMFDLGDADRIDDLIRSFKASLRSTWIDGAAETRAWLPPGLQLTDVIITPLEQALADVTRLFLAPDGELNSLPFEVLPTDDHGSYLLDRFEISYLSTGRDLLFFDRHTRDWSGDSLIAADPDFDLAVPHDQSSTVPAGSAFAQSRDLDRSSVRFDRLPGTRAEGETVAALLGVQPLLERDVLESRLKSRRGPQILHLATHGFFLPDQERPWYERFRRQIGAAAIGADDDTPGAPLENPLLRSGVALAGANTWLRGGELPDEAEDGILTAVDASALDLSGTELVVLSACDTGLGEIHAGEGVFGLRRAFLQAGAGTVIMSLWKVPDDETSALMRYFYDAILAGGTRAGALRTAQLKLRASAPHPFNWGGFICQGAPGVLSVRPTTARTAS